jgi:hypothetical protein
MPQYSLNSIAFMSSFLSLSAPSFQTLPSISMRQKHLPDILCAVNHESPPTGLNQLID